MVQGWNGLGIDAGSSPRSSDYWRLASRASHRGLTRWGLSLVVYSGCKVCHRATNTLLENKNPCGSVRRMQRGEQRDGKSSTQPLH